MTSYLFKTFNISTKEHLTTTRVKLKLYFDFQIDLFNIFFPFFRQFKKINFECDFLI